MSCKNSKRPFSISIICIYEFIVLLLLTAFLLSWLLSEKNELFLVVKFKFIFWAN